MSLRAILQEFNLSPRWRMQRHIDYLKDNIKIEDELDKKNFDTIYQNFEYTARKMFVYIWLRNIVFVLLYVSFVTAIARTLNPALELVLQPIVAVGSVLGVTLLTILLFVFQKIINTVLNDLQMRHAHLVAIAVKHNKDFEVHPTYIIGVFPDYK